MGRALELSLRTSATHFFLFTHQRRVTTSWHLPSTTEAAHSLPEPSTESPLSTMVMYTDDFSRPDDEDDLLTVLVGVSSIHNGDVY